MKGNFKYVLQPYKGPSTRVTCPGCGKRNKFSRYVEQNTGEVLAYHVGRCDREDNCGYHLTPKQYLEQISHSVPSACSQSMPVENRPVSTLPFDLMEKSVSRHEHADIFPFLASLFGEPIASRLCMDYFVGSNKDGLTTFWQVAKNGEVRQCKVMHYLPTGRRDKQTGAFFAGKKILGDYEANLQQCFFGEFLLSFPENKEKPVAIVESEKTALIASVYFSQLVWLATGGKNGAKWTEAKVCRVLEGRTVILFPDLGAYDQWKEKGSLLAEVAGCKVAVSDLLKKNAIPEEEQEGLDIADFLLRNRDTSGLALTDEGYPIIWDHKISVNHQMIIHE